MFLFVVSIILKTFPKQRPKYEKLQKQVSGVLFSFLFVSFFSTLKSRSPSPLSSVNFSSLHLSSRLPSPKLSLLSSPSSEYPTILFQEKLCFGAFGICDSYKFYFWYLIDLGIKLLSIQFDAILRSFGAVTARRSSSFLLKVSSKNFLRRVQMGTHQNSILRGCSCSSRGALVVLEGLDRCGKTTQSSRLVQYLEGLGHSAELWRFPDRTTSVGQMISSYLSNKSHLDDHTIHLLFSANRWEKRQLMETKLKSGTTLIVDRYSYSGVAFSSAKGLGIEWCKAPEVGLLAPDLVLYLEISPEKAAERGGYGCERYEQLEFQSKVAQYYQVLRDSSWKIIDACQPMEDIEKQLQEIVLGCVKRCHSGVPLSQLWLS